MELLLIIAFIWLFCKAVGLAFKVAWGTAKIAAWIFVTLAVPAFALCLMFAGGVVLLVPMAMIAAAFCLLKRV